MRGKLTDLTGQVFSRLTVLSFAGMNGQFSTWLCRCECGIEKVIAGRHLSDNRTRSCGCLKKKPSPTHLVGKKYGRLTVIRFWEYQNGHSAWLCECDCGESKVIRSMSFKNGNTQSCGCLSTETRKNSPTRFMPTHGESLRPEYKIWNAMMQRCYNPNQKSYEWYGERGIEVSPEWHDFEIFLSDMGSRPEGFTIDRINNDAGYSKDNCRWTDTHTQSRNKRNNVMISYDGLTMCLTDWAIRLGVSREGFRQRFLMHGIVPKTFEKNKK